MNSLHWFEIPALGLDRAFRFCSRILHDNVRKGTFGNGEYLLFNVSFHTGEAVVGSVVLRDDIKPSAEGTLMYLNAFGKLTDAVSKAFNTCGFVISLAQDPGKFGYTAIIIDSEGNKISLLSHEL